MKKKNSTHFPSMAVCCATLFSPTKGKSTWGVEIQQYNPILVDGRPLLPSLPSHRTLYADTLSTRPFLVDGRPLLPSLPSHRTLSAGILRESKLLPPFTRGQPSAGRGPRYQRRAIGDTFWTRPFLVDGRPLLPSLAFPSYALCRYALDSDLPRRWPSTAPFAAFPSHALCRYALDSVLPRRWPSTVGDNKHQEASSW